MRPVEPKPTIEVYFDPRGFLGGERGCYRARLQANHGMHDVGRTPREAALFCITTICSLEPNMPACTAGYSFLRLNEEMKPADHLTAWDVVDPADDARRVADQRRIDSMCARLFKGRIW